MCRRGRQLLLWLVLFVTAGFDPMLGLDEEKPNRVGRDRHTGMPSIISSTTDLFWAAGIFLLTLSVIILLSLKKISLPVLTYRTAKSTYIGKGFPLLFIRVINLEAQKLTS